MGAIDLSRIGTSDYPAILGVDPYRSSVELFGRLVHGIEPPKPDWLARAARCGQVLEAATAELYVEMHLGGVEGTLAKNSQHIHTTRPWQRYHAGDFTFFPRDSGPSIVIECKARNRWSYQQQGWGEQDTDRVPESVLVQVQGQLEAISSDSDVLYEEIHVAVLVDGQDVKRFLVRRDPELGAMIVAEAERFWRDHIETKIPPAPDGSSSARDYLLARYPGAGKRMREATLNENTIASELREALASEKEWRVYSAELSQLLQRAIGSDLGLYGPGWSARWPDQKGRDNTRKALERLQRKLKMSERDLERVLEETRGKPTRTFRVRFDGEN